MPKVTVLRLLLHTLAAVNMAALRSTSPDDVIELGVVLSSRSSDGSKDRNVIAAVPWQDAFYDVLAALGHDDIDSALRELEKLEKEACDEANV